MKIRFFKGTFHPSWMRVLRTGTALLALSAFFAFWPDIALLYSPEGLADPQLLQQQSTGTRSAVKIMAGLHRHTGLSYKCLLTVFAVIYTAAGLLLSAGIVPRFSAALMWLLQHSLFIAQPHYSYGMDYLTNSLLCYCFLLTSGRHPYSIPALRILQLHLCLVYFFGGLAKLIGPSWRDGDAVYKALTQTGFTGLVVINWQELADWTLLWVTAGWSVVTIELLYPVFIWPRATRRYWLWATVGLHLGIVLFMGLYFFAGIMVLWNLAAFYYPYSPHTTITDRPYHTTPSVHPPAGRQPLHKPGANPAGRYKTERN